MEINNKVAVVTGGIGGIGIATVQHFLKNGAKYVAILDVLKPDEDSVTRDLNEIWKEFNKGKCGYYQCDVTDSDRFEDIYKKIMEKHEHIDILVNNAGIANERKVDLMIDINFKAVIKCTLTAMKYMAITEGGKGGVIVNNASGWGVITSANLPLYGATKHAVVSFVRSMKEYNKILGVRILCICPGQTRTNMAKEEMIQSCGLDLIKHFRVEMPPIATSCMQDPSNVGKAIVRMIKEAEAGDVWLVMNDEPPLVVEDMERADLLKIRELL